MDVANISICSPPVCLPGSSQCSVELPSCSCWSLPLGTCAIPQLSEQVGSFRTNQLKELLLQSVINPSFPSC